MNSIKDRTRLMLRDDDLIKDQGRVTGGTEKVIGGIITNVPQREDIRNPTVVAGRGLNLDIRKVLVIHQRADMEKTLGRLHTFIITLENTSKTTKSSHSSETEHSEESYVSKSQGAILPARLLKRLRNTSIPPKLKPTFWSVL